MKSPRGVSWSEFSAVCFGWKLSQNDGFKLILLLSLVREVDGVGYCIGN